MDCSIPKDCWPVIDLYDQNGKAITAVGAGTLTISGRNGETVLLDDEVQIRGISKRGWTGGLASLGVGFMGGHGGELTLSGKDGTTVELMSQGLLPGGEGGTLNLRGKSDNSVFLDSDSPLVEIADGKGSYMDLGSTGFSAPRTGATTQTSAASIVMFGNDKHHHVVWQAPCCSTTQTMALWLALTFRIFVALVLLASNALFLRRC
jgi:hypothetical protein